MKTVKASMELQIHLVKAFTQDKTQGNPAGVILDANGLTDEQMMGVSAELGFSESAFVQHSNKADFKIRFFTPTQEVDLCGHATIATFYTLFKTGRIALEGVEHLTKTQESKAGILPVTIHEDGLIVMTQPQPVYGEIVKDMSEIAALLGLVTTDIDDRYPTQTVSTGSPKLLIPLKSRKALLAIRPNFAGIAVYCQRHGIKGFYPFTSETIDESADFHTRQFNPLAGIDEDPITGVAAGALGAYAAQYALLPKTKIVIEQGYSMNKPGKIYVEISGTVTVGGYATLFGQKTVVL